MDSMSTTVHHYRQRAVCSIRECIICGSKAIGINFGAATCAPCKAFFRRNARRKEILETSCQHSDTNTLEENTYDIDTIAAHYSQIRRCSSCRLRRCFEVGMKEELVRTDEENERHKQLVGMNRKRRDLLKQQQLEENQLTIQQCTLNNNIALSDMDWRHLSNIIYAYDTYCLKDYLQLRENMFSQETLQKPATMEYHSLLPINLTFSVSSFLKSLPAFRSLPRINQSFLCKNNLRRLILVNNHEINQSCFSEPWQIASRKASWKFLCGTEIYNQFIHTEELAEKFWITDPIVTRLWIIILFFSTSLLCYHDSKSSILKLKKKSPSTDVQNAYVTLLWKYLLYRHGYMEAVRIYSNLIHVFLDMLRVGLSINIRLRTQHDFMTIHETLDQLVTVDVNNTP